MANFIDYAGSGSYGQPHVCTGFHAQFFVLKASIERLRAVTDLRLNGIPNSPYVYKPLAGVVMCSPIWIDKIQAADPNLGWMRESDFSFSYVVGAFKDGWLDHIAVTFPYIIVDSPVTMQNGREIWGYPKQWGQFEYTGTDYQPVAAEAWVLTKYAPATQMTLTEVVRVIPPDAHHESIFEEIGNLEHAVADAAIDTEAIIGDIIAAFLKPKVPMVFLLQLRDVQYPDQAAYQALIEAPLTITRVRSASLVRSGHKIQLTDYDSYPLIRDLGIEVDAANIATPRLSFAVDFDCILEPGVVLQKTLAGV